MFKQFPSLMKNNFIFCDNAGGSQIPEQVINRLNTFLTTNYVQPGANNILSKKLNNDLKEIYNITNILLNNKSGEIIYGNSCSQLVYNLANSMEDYLKNSKGEIILSDFNHESCITPFERIAKKYNLPIKWWSIIEKNNELSIDYNDIINKVNKNTSLLVIPHVSNLLGNIIDINHLRKEIYKKNNNVKILVDGVAYMSHKLIDLDNLNIDFYVVSFYKFCGLRISALYVKEDNYDLIKNQNHYFFNNENIINNKLQIGGVNYECATSILGLKDYLIDIATFFKFNNLINNGSESIFTRKLVEFVYSKVGFYENVFFNIFDKLKNNDNINILQINNLEKTPIFSLTFNDFNINNVNLILNELGLICKTGTFYCDRLLNKLNIKSVLRISLMHYNKFEDAITIVKYLNYFKKYNIDFNYTINSIYKNRMDKNLQLLFNNLPSDIYYNNKRNRGYSLLKVDDINNVEIIGNLKFYQSEDYNSYNGEKIRDYENIESQLLKNSTFLHLISIFLDNVKLHIKDPIDFIQVHQIRAYANQDNINLTPEGIHKDGYNIIGIVCISRENVTGAITEIFDNSKNLIHNVQLQEGEMAIINDNKLYHNVTNLNLYDKNKEGFRDIFVFTTIS